VSGYSYISTLLLVAPCLTSTHHLTSPPPLSLPMEINKPAVCQTSFTRPPAAGRGRNVGAQPPVPQSRGCAPCIPVFSITFDKLLAAGIETFVPEQQKSHAAPLCRQARDYRTSRLKQWAERRTACLL